MQFWFLPTDVNIGMRSCTNRHKLLNSYFYCYLTCVNIGKVILNIDTNRQIPICYPTDDKIDDVMLKSARLFEYRHDQYKNRQWYIKNRNKSPKADFFPFDLCYIRN